VRTELHATSATETNTEDFTGPLRAEQVTKLPREFAGFRYHGRGCRGDATMQNVPGLSRDFVTARAKSLTARLEVSVESKRPDETRFESTTP
jgi:hypothetical protein